MCAIGLCNRIQGPDCLVLCCLWPRAVRTKEKPGFDAGLFQGKVQGTLLFSSDLFFLGRRNHRNHTAVQLTAFCGAIVRDRTFFTVAHAGQAAGIDIELVDQHLANRFSAALGQAEVVGVGADRVGMALRWFLRPRKKRSELNNKVP